VAQPAGASRKTGTPATNRPHHMITLAVCVFRGCKKRARRKKHGGDDAVTGKEFSSAGYTARSTLVALRMLLMMKLRRN